MTQTFPPATTGLPDSTRNRLVITGAATIALLIIFASTARQIVTQWRQDPLAHGYLVIPAVAFLVWERRAALIAALGAAEFRLLPVIALAAFGWLLGTLTQTNIAQQVCLVLLTVALIWGLLGTTAAKTLVFPLGFLLFALPIGDRIVPPLQDLAARFAVAFLTRSGVPALLQGHVISIPGESWRVAEACSGINYLVASLALSYFYAGTAYRYWRHRIGFLAAAVLVPLIGNGLRVYLTIFLASHGFTRIVDGTRHYLFGWLVFAAFMAILFYGFGRWREARPARQLRPIREPRHRGSGRHAVAFAATALLIASLAPLSAQLYAAPTELAQATALQPPSVSAPWTRVRPQALSWQPSLDGPTARFDGTYEANGAIVNITIGYYGPLLAQSKLVGSLELSEAAWLPVQAGGRPATWLGQSFETREWLLESLSAQLKVWTWYEIDGSFTASDYLAKLLLARSRLFRRDSGATVITVATEVKPGQDAAKVLQEFLTHFEPPKTDGQAR